MIRYAAAAGGEARQVLLFGSGLIGSAIDRALIRQHRWSAEALAWPWSDHAERIRSASRIAAEGDFARTDIVWAAGVSGFGSSDEDMARETALVGEVAELAGALARRSDRTVFHLVSSLGGLFEGQRGINPQSRPAPRRAYGRGKLAQEALAQSLGPAVAARIYRPSSVYGTARRGRRGLFTAIVAAMVQQKPLTISGSANTLRDYVFAEDVAQYLTGLIASACSEPGIDIVASGKPTSVAEAIFAIEAQFGRRLYCRYDSDPNNALDMTVRLSALPPSLPRTALPIGIAAVMQSVTRSLVA